MGGGARADRCPGCASSAGPRARQSQEQQTMKLACTWTCREPCAWCITVAHVHGQWLFSLIAASARM